MSATATTTSADLVTLVARGASFEEISAFLESLDPAGRVEEIRKTGRREQARLWELAKGKVALDLATFVGPRETTRIYEGKNVLPVFSHFQKRFYWPAEGDVVGYNHNPPFLTTFTGPGYFVTEQAPDGEIAFDYTKAARLQPPGWPPVRANAGLIPGIVFGGMIDYVRCLATGVVIGAAFKGGQPRDQYFMLARAA